MGETYIPATPFAKKLAKERNISLAGLSPTGPFGEMRARDIPDTAPSPGPLRATKLAAAMARGMGINLADVTGTGYGGKVTKADILAHSGGAAREAAVPAVEGETRRKLTGMRKVVARRMLQSHLDIPPVTHTVKVDVTALLEMRRSLQEMGQKYSINDFVLLATARALDQNRFMLVSLEGDDIVQKDRVNLGMAVALSEGLVVPVIRDADALDLPALSRTAKDLAKRARENRLLPDEYAGSTFSVTNLGMYQVEAFTPIINQPDAAILGVCCVEEELCLKDGQVAVRQVMRTCLTYDHRLLDGADAAKFQLEVKRLLEHPAALMLKQGGTDSGK